MKKYLPIVFCAIILASFAIPLYTAKAQATNGSVSFSWLFVSCDASGNPKDTFLTNENVYIKGGYFSPSIDVTIYVIPNGKPIKPENAVSGPITATTLPDHSLPITLVWSTPLTPGKYDIWIDVNRDGEFDCCDQYRRLWCFYLFLVVPELSIGTIGAVIVTFASLGVFYKVKRKQP